MCWWHSEKPRIVRALLHRITLRSVVMACQHVYHRFFDWPVFKTHRENFVPKNLEHSVKIRAKLLVEIFALAQGLENVQMDSQDAAVYHKGGIAVARVGNLLDVEIESRNEGCKFFVGDKVHQVVTEVFKHALDHLEVVEGVLVPKLCEGFAENVVCELDDVLVKLPAGLFLYDVECNFKAVHTEGMYLGVSGHEGFTETYRTVNSLAIQNLEEKLEQVFKILEGVPAYLGRAKVDQKGFDQHDRETADDVFVGLAISAELDELNQDRRDFL